MRASGGGASPEGGLWEIGGFLLGFQDVGHRPAAGGSPGSSPCSGQMASRRPSWGPPSDGLLSQPHDSAAAHRAPATGSPVLQNQGDTHRDPSRKGLLETLRKAVPDVSVSPRPGRSQRSKAKATEGAAGTRAHPGGFLRPEKLHTRAATGHTPRPATAFSLTPSFTLPTSTRGRTQVVSRSCGPTSRLDGSENRGKCTKDASCMEDRGGQGTNEPWRELQPLCRCQMCGPRFSGETVAGDAQSRGTARSIACSWVP